ncbi:MAG: 50S ribosomal protein L15e [Candidatus Aenigmarchaeota archaeon]|nr:50S ribosomal protein L15e [Candidatus Aenigmarchaeota archaeon]
MVNGLYKSLRETWKKPRENLGETLRQRLTEWREQHVVVRVPKPTRLDRAHELGFKAKLGYTVARVRVKKGGRRRRHPDKGRKPRKMGLVHFTPAKSLQWIGEEKVQRKFTNMEVLNSYQVGEDGVYKWFEVILVDPTHPNLKNNPKMKWVTNPANRKRVHHGLTSAAKKSRGSQ